MPFGADRAAGHQEAVAHPADPRILDAVILVAGARGDGAIVVDRLDAAALWIKLDGEQPRQRRQRHHLPSAAAHQELARIGGVDELERPGIELVGSILPADRADVAVADRGAQRLGDADHQEEVAVGQPSHAGIEGAEDIGLLIDVPGERRAREINVVGREDEVIEREGHS